MFDKTGSRARTLWTLAITSVGLFMVVLDNLVVSTALPVIRVDLGASIEELEWTVNAYTLTFAVFLLTGAALGDRFGARPAGVDRVNDGVREHEIRGFGRARGARSLEQADEQGTAENGATPHGGTSASESRV